MMTMFQGVREKVSLELLKVFLVVTNKRSKLKVKVGMDSQL